MGVQYLSVPAGGIPSSYTPSIADLENLYGNLDDLSGSILINQAGEGLSVEYPSEIYVASLVMDGGIYIDWCGWPMYYAPTGSGWSQNWNNYTRFGNFLQSAGVSDEYITTFIPEPAKPPEGLTGLTCPGAAYTRMWVSNYLFPLQGSVIIESGPVVQCDNTGLGPMYAYEMVAVHAGSGWYFWANNKIDPVTYANFIRQTLGYSPIGGQQPGGTPPPGPGSNPNCPGTQYFDGVHCVPKPGSGTPTCEKGTWDGTQCVVAQEGISLPNWLLIVGGAAAGLGLIALLFMLEGG